MKLTKKQTTVFSYIKKHPESTYEEIRKSCGFKWVGSVAAIIKALSKKGLISYNKKNVWVVYEQTT